MSDASLKGFNDARWRAVSSAQRKGRADLAENLTVWWSGFVLVLMLLYVLIGNKPFDHEVALDPLTGALEVSPINRYIWLALAGLSIPSLWGRRTMLADLSRRLWPLLLLMGWFALTTRWALDPATSNRRLILYLVNVLICIAVTAGLNDSRRIHACIAWACALVAIADLLSWIIAPGLSMTDLGLAAIHSHKNTLGAVMLLSGFVCGAFAWAQTTWKGRAFWWGITIISVVLLVASLSKTSMGIYAALVLGAPALLALLRRRQGTLIGILACVVFTLIAVAFGWMAWCYAQAADPFAPFLSITFTQRTDVWAFVVQQIKLHPLQGAGFASFWDIDPAVQPSLQSDAWFAQPDAFTNEAHNGYLDLTVSTGLVGLAGALFVLFRWMSRGLKLMRRDALASGPGSRRILAASMMLAIFPLLVFCHNFLESSYFTANSIFGAFVLLLGIEADRAFTAPKPTPAP